MRVDEDFEKAERERGTARAAEIEPFYVQLNYEGGELFVRALVE